MLFKPGLQCAGQPVGLLALTASGQMFDQTAYSQTRSSLGAAKRPCPQVLAILTKANLLYCSNKALQMCNKTAWSNKAVLLHSLPPAHLPEHIFNNNNNG